MSLAQLMVVLLIILIVFGAGRLPKVMSDLGKGVQAFRDSLKNDDQNPDKDEK